MDVSLNDLNNLFIEQLPFICSIAALFAGVLIGKPLGRRYGSTPVWLGAIICLLCVFMFKNQVGLALSAWFSEVGLPQLASNILGGVLVTFVGGVALALVLLDAGKSEKPADGKQASQSPR